jgi:hypothetical protein
MEAAAFIFCVLLAYNMQASAGSGGGGIGRISCISAFRSSPDNVARTSDIPISVNYGHATLPIHQIRCYFMSELTDS